MKPINIFLVGEKSESLDLLPLIFKKFDYENFKYGEVNLDFDNVLDFYDELSNADMMSDAEMSGLNFKTIPFDFEARKIVSAMLSPGLSKEIRFLDFDSDEEIDISGNDFMIGSQTARDMLDSYKLEHIHPFKDFYLRKFFSNNTSEGNKIITGINTENEIEYLLAQMNKQKVNSDSNMFVLCMDFNNLNLSVKSYNKYIMNSNPFIIELNKDSSPRELFDLFDSLIGKCK
jgi:hypothetical protein